MSQSSRDRRRQKAKKMQAKNNLTVGLLIVIGMIIVAGLVWNSVGRPPIGEEVIADGEGDHLPEGSPLPQYSTNPPTSGTHYPTWFTEGFYEENSAEAVSTVNPEGYIVHNLEHGYVVFWYNCEILTAADCDALKTEIRSVMSDYNNFKIIAFPWAETTVPVVGTSWGRYLEFQTWDAELAAKFIEQNRNHSPEPNAR